MKFPPDLIARIRTALERHGFCFLSHDEIQRLLAEAPPDRSGRQRALQEFAEICGAEVETTTHFKSARFVPAGAVQRDSAPSSDALLRTALAS